MRIQICQHKKIISYLRNFSFDYGNVKSTNKTDERFKIQQNYLRFCEQETDKFTFAMAGNYRHEGSLQCGPSDRKL